MLERAWNYQQGFVTADLVLFACWNIHVPAGKPCSSIAVKWKQKEIFFSQIFLGGIDFFLLFLDLLKKSLDLCGQEKVCDSLHFNIFVLIANRMTWNIIYNARDDKALWRERVSRTTCMFSLVLFKRRQTQVTSDSLFSAKKDKKLKSDFALNQVGSS